ncbi:ubiquinol-cytochrome c reductase iron-sulfur subunit [Candidatus Latescibacterota bacterium]
MRLRHSLIDRRRVLRSLLGGWAAALVATIVYPVARFLVPPVREPEEVLLPLADCQALGPYDAMPFAWGSKPALLLKKEDGLRAFVTVCTHLDCNVSWRPTDRRFFCACHEGWFDDNGLNIAGPPPLPLRQLAVEITAEAVIVKPVEVRT